MAQISNTTLVRDYIRDYISRQNLQPGDMLPAEGEIAQTLQISKSSVREATRALEGLGLIEIKHGIGLVLRTFNLDAFVVIWEFSALLDPGVVLELYDMRRIMETALIMRVIQNVDDATLAKCDAIIAEWETIVRDGGPDYDIDRRFHETLYSLVSNKTLTSLGNVFWTAQKEMEARNIIRRANPKSRSQAEKTLQDHKGILAAIKNKDTALGMRLMEGHFSELKR